MNSPATLHRARLAGAAATLLGAGASWWFARAAVAAFHAPLPDAFAIAIDGLLAAATAWATVLVALAVRELGVPRRHQSLDGSRSTLVHRIAGLLLTVAAGSAVASPSGGVGGTVVATASADAGVPDPALHPLASDTRTATPTPSTEAAAPSPDLTRSWTPRRPARDPHDGALVLDKPRATSPAEVVVRRGDTLWSIVERRLGQGTDPVLVATEVRRWHLANLGVIGPDADLLHAGQRLVPPMESGR